MPFTCFEFTKELSDSVVGTRNIMPRVSTVDAVQSDHSTVLHFSAIWLPEVRITTQW